MTRTLWDLSGDLPVAGRHYPASFGQFNEWFSTEEQARGYLEAVRFRRGLACGRCGVLGPRRTRNGAWWCGSCRRHFSTTSGTLMDRSHLPPSQWLAAVWLMTNTKSGVSAVSLSRSLGINYNSAWHLLHKLRTAMSFAHHDRLRGEVELDETFVGGFDEGAGSGGPQSPDSNKITILVATERATPTAIGRIRMARSYESSALCLARFIADTVEPRATLVTDGWTAYPRALELLEPEGLNYELHQTSMRGTPGHAHDYLPGVHRVASLLKRWLLGTHQGAVSAHQIDHYLSEFVFRFNRRSSQHRGLLFWRLACALTDSEPVRRIEITGRKAEMAQSDQVLAIRIEELHIEHKRVREVLSSRAYRARKAARLAAEREAG